MTVRPEDNKSAHSGIGLNAEAPVASTARLLPWVAGLSLLAFAAGANLGKATTLSATFGTQPTTDSDLDGFANSHEEVLGLSMDLSDTDSDGWSDVEEVARGSQPKNASSVPGKTDVDVSVTGYMDDGLFHVIASVYLKGGVGSGHNFKLGFFHRGVAHMLPPSIYLPHAEVTLVPGQSATDAIYILDVSLPFRLVNLLGEVSFFALAETSRGGQSRETSHLNVVVHGDIPFAVTTPGGSGGSTSSGSHSTSSGAGFYTPLTPMGNLPAGSKTGRVCVQTSRVVGSGGGGVQLEVISASCQDGDGTCVSSCGGSVGTTFGGLDPLVLVGG
ncbi:MAG: hypothetical protein ACI8TQ_000602 [Planctomycetota bacterium]|jgi:hypothetical protein